MFRHSSNVLAFHAPVGGGPARAKRRGLRHARSRVDPAAILDSLDPAVVGQDLDGVISTCGCARTAARQRSGCTVRDATHAIVGVSTIESAVGASGRPSLLATEALLRSSFEDAPIGIALVSVEASSAGRLLRSNKALCELTGHSPEWLGVANVSELMHPDDVATDRAAMASLHAAEIDSFHLEQRLLHAERHVVWVTVDASLVRDAAGRPLYCIRQLQNIEERKRYEGELGYLVEHDPLTGLLNRRGFVRELTHEMVYVRRYGGGHGL